MLEYSLQTVILYAAAGTVGRDTSIGIFVSINCVQVFIVHDDVLDELIIRKLAKIHRNRNTIHIGYVTKLFILIGWRIHLSLKYNAQTVFRSICRVQILCGTLFRKQQNAGNPPPLPAAAGLPVICIYSACFYQTFMFLRTSSYSGTLEMPPCLVVDKPALVQAKVTTSRSCTSFNVPGA